MYGHPTSTTTLLLLPAGDATVGQVNDALASVGATLLGGLALLDVLVVAVPRVNDPLDIPDRGDHAGVLTALDALRASPAFRVIETAPDSPTPQSGAVAPVWLEDVDVVPAPFAPDPAGVFPIWTYVPGVWPATGDWGLAATRAPAAWNLLDNARATMRQDGQQDTVVFDAGFDTTHPDLNFASTESTAINQHGTHVSSTIGATYDNRRGTTSQGMSGINPVARLHGVQFDRSTATTVDEFETILGGKIAGGSYPTLRVINASLA